MPEVQAATRAGAAVPLGGTSPLAARRRIAGGAAGRYMGVLQSSRRAHTRSADGTGKPGNGGEYRHDRIHGGHGASDRRVLVRTAASGAAAGVAEAALAFAPVGAAATGPLNGSGGATAAVAPSGDQRIDGLLSGVKWGAGSISYSDPNSAGDYQASHPENFTHFQQISAAQLRAAHATLSDTILTQPPGAYSYSVEGFTNLSIDYAGAGTGAGTIRLANTDDPDTAYAYYPSNAVYGGDVFFGASGRSPDAGQLRLLHRHPRARPLARAEARPRGRRLRRAAVRHQLDGILGDDLPVLRRRGRSGRLQRDLGLRPDLHDVRHRRAAAHVRRGLHATTAATPSTPGTRPPARPSSTATLAHRSGRQPHLPDDLGRQRHRHLRPVELCDQPQRSTCTRAATRPSPSAQLADLDVGPAATSRAATSSTRCSSTATPAR